MRLLWRRRQWRLLLNLIDHLPRDSYFVEALLDDEEFATQLLNMPDAPKPRERLSEWSSEREGMARLEELLSAVERAVYVAARIKPPKPRRVKRPDTAVDRVKKQRSKTEHDHLVSVLLPHRADNPPVDP